MLTLRQFIKNQIKSQTTTIRELKSNTKKLQQQVSRLSQGESGFSDKDYKEIYWPMVSGQSKLPSLKIEARYQFLVYAQVRNQDLAQVEINPKTPHDPEKLATAKKELESRYQHFITAQFNLNE